METLINLLGGIALLLWGIRMVRTGVTRGFGARLRRTLAGAVSNRLAAFAGGLGITAILQSSTATALIASSFAGRGFITVGVAIAVMLGADVGTTLVVQVLSFDLLWLSPLLIAVGVIGFNLSDDSKRRALSRIAIGLGLMLLSLKLISTVSAPLRDSEAVAVLLGPLTAEPVLAVVAAALLTWAAHSSVAFIILVASMAAIQVISVHLALAFVIGANLGSALVALALNWRAPPKTRRVPLGNVLIKLAGVALGLMLLPWLQPYLALISDDPGHMVANFHTIFNVALALIFLPFVEVVAKLTERLVPEEQAAAENGRPRYLDDDALDTPAESIALAAREALRMGDEVEQMLLRSIDALTGDDMKTVKAVEATEEVVDRLHEAIKLYLTKINENELDTFESRQAVQILMFTANLEHIGDIIDKNLMDVAARRMKAGASFSDEGLAEIKMMHERVSANFKLAMNVFMSGDTDLARQLLEQKIDIRALEQDFVERHYWRIGAGRPESIESSAYHIDILRDLKRINSHLTSVAYPILERAGALTQSRLRPVDQAGDVERETAVLFPNPSDR